MHIYSAFGLRIDSSFELPLRSGSSADYYAQIKIKKGKIDHSLKALAARKHYSVLPNNEILCSVADVAYYLIRSDEIIVDAFEGTSEEAIRLFLFGSAMGAALYQQKSFLLHGCAIKIGNEAVIFSGPSGIGKSSLATAFIQNGYPILTDDVAVIRFENGRAIVWPTHPQVKLWKDGLEAIGKSQEGLEPILNRLDKFSVPLKDSDFHSKPLAVKALFTLEKSEEPGISCKRVFGQEAFGAVHNDCYRIQFLQKLGSPSLHFSQSAQFSNCTPVYRLYRSQTGCSPSMIRDFSISILESETERREDAIAL